MKLPIPDVGPDSSENRRRFTEAVNQIDRAKFGKEFLKNYKERTPLTKSDFKDLSKKWIFVINKNGNEKYLMFITNDKSELDELMLYYVEFYYSEIDVGTPYQNLRFGISDFFYGTKEALLTWANVYLITSIDSYPFMNWTETPWGVK